MLFREGIVARDLDRVALGIFHQQFLLGGADKPGLHRFVERPGADVHHHGIIQPVGGHTHGVAGHQQLELIVCQVFSAFIGQASQRKQALSVVQDRVCDFRCDFHRFGDQAGVDLHIFDTCSLQHIHVLSRQDHALFQQGAVCGDIAGQDAADQAGVPGHGDRDDVLFVEFAPEGIGIHVGALRQFFPQEVSLIPSDVLSLFHDDIAIHVQDVLAQRLVHQTGNRVQLLLQLVPACLGQVIAPVVEEFRLHQGDGSVQCGDFIRALVFVEGEQRLFVGLDFVVEQRVLDLFILAEEGVVQQEIEIHIFPVFRVFRHVLEVPSQGLQEGLHGCLVVGILVFLQTQGHAQCLEENREQDLPAPVNGHIDGPAVGGLLLFGHELQPCAAAGNQFAGVVLAPDFFIVLLGEIGSGGTDDLTDNDTFRTVDDERAGIGHQREVPEIHFFVFRAHFAGFRVGDLQLHLHVERSCIVAFTVHRFFGRVLRFVEPVPDVVQADVLAVVFDRIYLFKDFLDPLFGEPVE